MKELSIEEKAKRYDKAFKEAEKIHNFSSDIAEVKRMEQIFPELKESEDERIRKRIIQALHGDVLDMDETTKAIAWLEKQGEQKPFDYEKAYIQQNDFAPKSAMEAIKEEKVDNANKVEQKPAWSEEDEEIVEALTSLCDEAKDNIPQLSALKNWLKSLKDRYTWKPTTEQLRELHCVISGCSFEISTLVELEENLKKLL